MIKPDQHIYKIDNVEIKNGNRLVPATIVCPSGKGPFPAVVMNHGHGGSKEEGGGFKEIASLFAKKGILSIRMDFPGCGESKEAFTQNYLSNMVADSNASLDYILSNYHIDRDRLGILGYSMGGRVALTIGSEENTPYKSMVLLAPSSAPGEEVMIGFVGGEEAYNKLKDEAMSDKGYADFTTIHGNIQTLSHQWLNEMRASYPLSKIGNFKGNMLVIYGDQDFVVPPKENQALLGAFPGAKEIVLENVDHGYGFFSQEPLVTKQVHQVFGNWAIDFIK